MKVILRPLRQDAWTGIVKYKNCYEDIGPYLSRSGVVYNGMLTADERKELSEELGLDLNPGSKYWSTFYIRTAGSDIILNTEEPMDRLKYLYLKGHKRVKTSLFEHKATANFVLINQEEEAKKDNLFGRLKRQASREFDKLSIEDMRKALRLFGKSSESLNNEMVESRLYSIVEGDPKGFIEKWVDNHNRETQYLIERAVAMNIVRKNKRIYTYGSDTIGHGIHEAIAFLDDNNNQDVKLAIIQAIEGKSPMESKASIEVIKDNVKEQVSAKVKSDSKKKKEDK